MLDEIKRLLKANVEKNRLNHIPNLKREIKANYVTPNDFEQIELRIQEAKINFRNVTKIK